MSKFITIIFILTNVTLSQIRDSVVSNINICGYVSCQAGQIKSGTYTHRNDIKDYWYQKVFANIGFSKNINKWLSLTTALEFNMRLSTKNHTTIFGTNQYKHDFYIDEARGDFYLIDNKSIRLGLTLGYFHFSYNPDVHNLGNNLFRSYCYPTAIVPSELDFPYTRLCGLDLSTFFFNGIIFNHFIATTHLELYPTNDLSITNITGIDLRGIRVGFGVQFDRILEMSEAITTPRNKSAAMVNPNNPLDTVYFTFAGTKLMSCLNFDLKKIIFGENYPSLFGKDDAKLFFEMNILGIKNYQTFYKKRKNRIPIAFGVLLPTFKILDILSLECEYFESLYSNSLEQLINSAIPFPDTHKNYMDSDDWKWSVYAKRSFSNFSIIFQIAQDHLQPWSIRSVDQIYNDVLIENDDYYYQFKFQFNF